ncbi:hypothetical protein ABZ626_16655 [Streptomyces longispororuber]|uniref:hypothetical protein n=1 Tax=Streptomyces longispororuber TaxID=68230 RepID=UPI0033DF8A10
MSLIDLVTLLAVLTALRVFLPDVRTGMRRLLRAAARLGVAELLQTPTQHPAPEVTTASPDTER